MRSILARIMRLIFSRISSDSTRHISGVSREIFGSTRKISLISLVTLVKFKMIEKCQKNDLGDEDLFYDEIISDANGELFNSKNQYANCICRPNNILITTFFFLSISVMVLLILRMVFKLRLSRWRLSHKHQINRNKVESSERFVNVVLENLSKRFARINTEIPKTPKCTTTIKTYMIFWPISIYLIDWKQLFIKNFFLLKLNSFQSNKSCFCNLFRDGLFSASNWRFLGCILLT